MGDLHIPKKIEQNIHQKVSFVYNKVFMLKTYNTVEETQIAGASITVRTQSG